MFCAIPSKADDHTILVKYQGGYIKENLPEDVKEAVIKLFHKRKTLRKMTNNEECKSDAKNAL